MGRIEISDLKLITSEPWLVEQRVKPSTRAKWRSSPSGWSCVGKKYLTQPAMSERPVYVIQSSERTMERMKFDGPSENNRRARFYRLIRAGRKLLETEQHDWEQTAAIIARFFEVKAEDLA